MDIDFDLEKQLMPVRLSRRWMQVMVLCAMIPSLIFVATRAFHVESGPVWYLWSASLQGAGVVLTILVAVMSFVYFRRVGDLSPPVIGIGLLCVGSMDLIQVFAGLEMGAASGTAGESARQSVEMSFSISRAFYAIVLMSAAAFTPLRERISSENERQRSLRTLLIFTGVFLVASVLLMSLSYGAEAFQNWVYSSPIAYRFLTWLPIALFLMAGLYVLPTHFHWHGRVFGQVMILSVIPMILAQVHLIADQRELGGHFMMAVLASTIGYLIPFVGLMVDYWKVYARLQDFYRVLQDRMLLFHQTRQVSDRGNDLFKQLMKHTEEPIIVFDTSRRVTQVNDKLAVDLGLSLGTKALPQLALARPVDKLLGEDVMPVLSPYFEKVDEKRLPVNLDTSLPIAKVDSLRALVWRLIPVFDSKHRIVVYMLVGTHGD